MVQVKIIEKKKSDFNDNELVFFEFLGQKKYTIVSDRVLKFLGINMLMVGDMIEVIKSFSDDGKERYLIRKFISSENGNANK